MLTVVVADASPGLRQVLTGVLERARYRVVTAEDGLSALRAVFQRQPDAVVLGALPGVSAPAARRLLDADWRTSDIPVVLLAPATDGSAGAVSLHGGPADLLAALTAALLTPRSRPRPGAVERDATRLLDAACRVSDLAAVAHAAPAAAAELPAPGDPARTAAAVFTAVGRFLRYDAAALLLVQPGAMTTAGPAGAADVLAARCAAMLHAVTGVPARDIRPTAVEGSDPRPGDGRPLRAVLATVLRDTAGPVAVLALGSYRPGTYDCAARAALGILSPRLASRIRPPGGGAAAIGSPVPG